MVGLGLVTQAAFARVFLVTTEQRGSAQLNVYPLLRSGRDVCLLADGLCKPLQDLPSATQSRLAAPRRHRHAGAPLRNSARDILCCTPGRSGERRTRLALGSKLTLIHEHYRGLRPWAIQGGWLPCLTWLGCFGWHCSAHGEHLNSRHFFGPVSELDAIS